MTLNPLVKSSSVSLRRTLNAGMVLGASIALLTPSLSGSPLLANETSPAPETSGDCVVSVETEGDTTIDCFDNFRVALEYATDGEITDAPMTAAAAVRDPEIQHELGIGAQFELATHNNTTSGSGQILSIEYENRGYQGNSLTYRGSGGCDADKGIEYSVPAISSDWNDEISSFVGANQCGVKHFENSYYGGSSTPWGGSDNYVGDAMNDRTSSLRWR